MGAEKGEWHSGQFLIRANSRTFATIRVKNSVSCFSSPFASFGHPSSGPFLFGSCDSLRPPKPNLALLSGEHDVGGTGGGDVLGAGVAEGGEIETGEEGLAGAE